MCHQCKESAMMHRQWKICFGIAIPGALMFLLGVVFKWDGWLVTLNAVMTGAFGLLGIANFVGSRFSSWDTYRKFYFHHTWTDYLMPIALLFIGGGRALFSLEGLGWLSVSVGTIGMLIAMLSAFAQGMAPLTDDPELRFRQDFRRILRQQLGDQLEQETPCEVVNLAERRQQSSPD